MHTHYKLIQIHFKLIKIQIPRGTSDRSFHLTGHHLRT